MGIKTTTVIECDRCFKKMAKSVREADMFKIQCTPRDHPLDPEDEMLLCKICEDSFHAFRNFGDRLVRG